MLLFADQPLGTVSPATGRAHLERVVGRLRLHPRSTSRGPTDLAAALTTVQGLAKRPSLIVLVTDFLVPDGWVLPLRSLARRHEVVGARLRDPREVSLPDVGLITFEDPETGEQLTVDTGSQRLRERFAQVLDRRFSLRVHVRSSIALLGIMSFFWNAPRAVFQI